MSILTKIDKENISIYEGLAPGKGELLYSILKDDVISFKKYYRSSYKDETISDLKLFSLLIESNSFNCILYFKEKEKKYFKSLSISMKKEVLKRLFITERISNTEISIFVKEFLKLRWTEEEKIQFYLTALIYAPKDIFLNYFESYGRNIENKHLEHIIKVFENNNVLSTKSYREDNKRLHLIYEQILKISRKRKVNWLHYVNSSYLGYENEIFRNEFFEYLSHKEKMKWINYLFKHLNLIYHATVLGESVENKYKRKGNDDDTLNLEFVVFIFDNILFYMKEKNITLNKNQMKKLILFKDALNKIANNVFLFSSIVVFQDLNNYIHEWKLKEELKRRNKNISSDIDRKKKKI